MNLQQLTLTPSFLRSFIVSYSSVLCFPWQCRYGKHL